MMYTHISKNHLSGEMPDRTLQGAARRKDIQAARKPRRGKNASNIDRPTGC